MNDNTIPVLVQAGQSRDETKGLIPKVLGITPVSIDRKILSENLNKLISSLGEIIHSAEISAGFSLSSVEVGVEVTAEGGVALIGSASLGANASITLTFDRIK